MTHFNIKGVQHAKYILVFTSKELHVCISTANVIRSNQTIDITWTGFFPKTVNPTVCNTDFGIVLQDFLEQQSDQIIARHMDETCCDIDSLLHWMNTVLGFNDISTEYDFSEIEVDLISTVPGNDPMPISVEVEECIYKEAYQSKKWLQNFVAGHCDDCVRKIHSRYRKKVNPNNLSSQGTTVAFDAGTRFRTYSGDIRNSHDVNEILKGCNWSENIRRPTENPRVKYGAERVKECILRHEVNLPDIPLDKGDQLIMQPTSISGGMNVDRISYLISCFKPHSIDVEDNDNFRTLRIIWPSCKLLKVINDTRRERYEKGEDKYFFHSGGGLYLDDKCFDEMLADGWNRMYSYQHSSSALFSKFIASAPPHNKTYGRILQHSLKTDEIKILQDSKDRNLPEGTEKDNFCTCYDLSYFLLSSACLSRGAQGDQVNIDICQQCHYIRPGYFEYKNFELGVLFQSSKKLQYRALNPKCVRHGDGQLLWTEKNLCILPVPYDMLGGDKYYDEDIEAFRRDISEPWIMIRDAAKEETKKRLLNVYSTHFMRSMGPAHNNGTNDDVGKIESLSEGCSTRRNIEEKRGQLEPPLKKASVDVNHSGTLGARATKNDESIISAPCVSMNTPQKLPSVDLEDESVAVLSPNSAGVVAYL